MKTPEMICEEIKSLEKERDALKAQIKPISKRIQGLKSQYWNKTHYVFHRGVTFSEKMIGKRYRDLSPEEKRLYDKISQRKHREKK